MKDKTGTAFWRTRQKASPCICHQLKGLEANRNTKRSIRLGKTPLRCHQPQGQARRVVRRIIRYSFGQPNQHISTGTPLSGEEPSAPRPLGIAYFAQAVDATLVASPHAAPDAAVDTGSPSVHRRHKPRRPRSTRFNSLK